MSVRLPKEQRFSVEIGEGAPCEPSHQMPPLPNQSNYMKHPILSKEENFANVADWLNKQPNCFPIPRPSSVPYHHRKKTSITEACDIRTRALKPLSLGDDPWYGRLATDVSKHLRVQMPPTNACEAPKVYRKSPLQYFPEKTTLTKCKATNNMHVISDSHTPSVLDHWWQSRPGSAPLAVPPQYVNPMELHQVLPRRIPTLKQMGSIRFEKEECPQPDMISLTASFDPRLSRVKSQRRAMENVKQPNRRFTPIGIKSNSQLNASRENMLRVGEEKPRPETAPMGKTNGGTCTLNPSSEPSCNINTVAHLGWPKSNHHNHIPINNMGVTKRLGYCHEYSISSSCNANTLIGRRKKIVEVSDQGSEISNENLQDEGSMHAFHASNILSSSPNKSHSDISTTHKPHRATLQQVPSASTHLDLSTQKSKWSYFQKPSQNVQPMSPSLSIQQSCENYVVCSLNTPLQGSKLSSHKTSSSLNNTNKEKSHKNHGDDKDSKLASSAHGSRPTSVSSVFIDLTLNSQPSSNLNSKRVDSPHYRLPCDSNATSPMKTPNNWPQPNSPSSVIVAARFDPTLDTYKDMSPCCMATHNVWADRFNTYCRKQPHDMSTVAIM